MTEATDDLLVFLAAFALVAIIVILNWLKFVFNIFWTGKEPTKTFNDEKISNRGRKKNKMFNDL